MPDAIEILRNSRRSVDSVDTEANTLLEVVSTTAPLIFTDVKGTVDLNEQYIKERNNCNDYRLMLTIKPYCTNILFNTCTEVVMKEGSNETDAVIGNDPVDRDTLREIGGKVKGKANQVSIYDMVRNTEYSKEDIGFEYHPGLDIFNNHILRNKSYRVVNDYEKGDDATREKFNTIEDYMRTANGKDLKRCCRKSISDTSLQKKHLYDKDDILPFYTGEAVSENLKEQDGWFGFYNTAIIPAKDRKGEDMDISRVINSKGNCEFIDMYPDRTLFSFVPKYNPYRNRLENNWDYIITYAFDKTTTYTVNDKEFDITLVKDGSINALATITVEYRQLSNGLDALFFRSATKHNLKSQDKVYIYFNLNEDNAEDDSDRKGDWKKSCHTYNVAGIGDINHKNEEYYFYITDMTLLEEIFCTPYLCDNDFEHDSEYNPWDYVRTYFYKEYDETKCGYVPDEKFVKYPKSGLTNIPSENDTYIEIVNDDSTSEKYVLHSPEDDIWYQEGMYDANAFIRHIINNAFTNNDNQTTNSQVNTSMNGYGSDYITVRFTKTNGGNECSYYVRKFQQITNMDGEHLAQESYPLAFSDTIYGDKVSQCVFTDNINTAGLKDNLGRDLTEVFLTIVKSNRGYEKWYGLNDGHKKEDVQDADVEYSHCFGPVTCGFELSMELNDTLNIRTVRQDFIDVTQISHDSNTRTIPQGTANDVITIDNEWFYGDIVEFCPWTCEETPVSDVCFRFNTAQREFGNDLGLEFKFDEIDTDDYDSKGFRICTYKVNNSISRQEGYYHKAHYRIPLAELGPVQQASHPYLSINDIVPVQSDDIYLMVTTNFKHHLMTSNGDKVLLRDTVADDTPEWWLDVVYILNDYQFIMKTIDKKDPNYKDWIVICKCVKDKSYTLRAENMSIPKDAARLGINNYLWREAVRTWDAENNDSEYNDYVFANGALYVDKCINFYLKRQDPYNVNGLYFDGSQCQIECTNNDNDNPCTGLGAVDKWFIADHEGEGIKQSSKFEYNETDYNTEC